LVSALACPASYPPVFLSKSASSPSHFILPSFFETLFVLLGAEQKAEQKAEQRRVSIVIRTYGDDISEVVDAITAFARGEHPLYPDFVCPALQAIPCCYGRYSDAGSFTVYSSETDAPVASSEHELVQLMESSPIMAIRDDYESWRNAGHSPSFGKPCFTNSPTAKHIFFDDNIHNDPDNSIVAVRRKASDSDEYEALSGEETLKLEGRDIVKVHTVLALMDKTYFLKKIKECESA
jgi:hypothetical protein